MKRSQGAKPAADHASQDEGQDDGDYSPQKRKEDFAGGDEGGQRQERVKVKEGFDSSDVVFSWESSLQQEIKEEDKKRCLSQDAERLDEAVFLRPFFFQSLTAPDQILQILFV